MVEPIDIRNAGTSYRFREMPQIFRFNTCEREAHALSGGRISPSGILSLQTQRMKANPFQCLLWDMCATLPVCYVSGAYGRSHGHT